MKVTDKYVFFCKGILGNWAKTPMYWCAKKFFSSEQLFMWLKALLFDDQEMMERIEHAKTSAEAKELGRQVKNFDQKIWDENKREIMRKALKCKLIYNEEFRDVLYANKDKLFVECNPHDRIWAIGLSEDDPRIEDPKNWRGENLLGQILTELANAPII